MQTITTIGFDIAKSIFQVHGVDASGQVIIRRQLKRRSVLAFFQKLPPCLVGIEACGSAHHWSREPLVRALKEVFRRHRSQPIERVIGLINPVLRGWVNSFAVGHFSEC